MYHLMAVIGLVVGFGLLSVSLLGCDSNDPTPAPVSADCSSGSDEPARELCVLVTQNVDQFDIKNYHKLHHNHVMYHLVVGYQFGLSSSELQAEYDKGIVGQDPAYPSTHFITRNNWVAHIGDNIYNTSGHFSDYLEFFRGEINFNGLNITLQRAWPHLVAGLAGDLFHAVIVLGYAWESPVQNEVLAQALAWLATSACEFPGAFAVDPPLRDVAETLMALSVDETVPLWPASMALPERLAASMAYADHISAYDLNLNRNKTELVALLQEMSLGVARLYQSTEFRDFFVLHLQTSMRAMDVFVRSNLDVLPLEQLQEGVRRYWRAVLFFFVAYNRPALPKIAAWSAKPSWVEMEKRSLAVDDTHLIKVVYLARENERMWGFAGDHAVWRSMSQLCLEAHEKNAGWTFGDGASELLSGMNTETADDLLSTASHRTQVCSNNYLLNHALKAQIQV